MAEKDTVPVYNIQEPPGGRQGGPYYDEVMARQAEEHYAAREGRKPDYSPAHLKDVAHPGRAVVTAEQLIAVHSTPGVVHTGPIKAQKMGEIPNPAKAEEDARKQEADLVQARAENAEAEAKAEAKTETEAEGGFFEDNEKAETKEAK